MIDVTKINHYKKINKLLSLIIICWTANILLAIVGLGIGIFGISINKNSNEINPFMIVGISILILFLASSYLVNFFIVKKIKRIILEINGVNTPELLILANWCIGSPVSKSLTLKNKIKILVNGGDETQKMLEDLYKQKQEEKKELEKMDKNENKEINSSEEVTKKETKEKNKEFKENKEKNKK